MAIIVLAVLLFPKAFIKQQLHAGGQPSAATITYLELLLRAQPDDRTTRLQLVRERLRAGQLEQAERELAPLARQSGPLRAQTASLWLGLRRAEFVAMAPDSPEREPGRAHYAEALHEFGGQLAPADQMTETRNAIAAGLYVTAAQMAGHLLTTTDGMPPAQWQRSAIDESPMTAGHSHARPGRHRTRQDLERGLTQLIGLVWSSRVAGHSATSTRQPDDITDLREQAFHALLQSHLAAGHPQDALRAAEAQLPSLDPSRIDWPQLIRIAVWAGKPTAAADFAQRWLASASDDATRWTAFQALIDAYLAADRPDQALATASRNLDRMPQTPELWRVMTRLAMQAGDTEKSAQFARRLVQLGPAHDD
jgi:tetratricopeptide (TPR) repeat protein